MNLISKVWDRTFKMAVVFCLVLFAIAITGCDFGGDDTPEETTMEATQSQGEVLEETVVSETELYVSVMGCFPVPQSDFENGIKPDWTGTISYITPNPEMTSTKVITITDIPVTLGGCFVTLYVPLKDIELGFWINTSEGWENSQSPYLAEVRFLTTTYGQEGNQIETRKVNIGEEESAGFPIWDANTYQ
ncbi:hypothetical protein HQ571_04565 [Candidatus Kuenenbacteria bacterium]|nr:hypothetical protein [Candidatus Kuenenbacteria bacterium]